MPILRTALIFLPLLALAAPGADSRTPSPRSDPTPAQRDSARHLLGRAAWGARPGEVERVAAMGVGRWIDAQLDAARIADPAGDAIVARYAVLRRTPAEMNAMYRAQIAQVRARSQSAPTPGADPGLTRANLELQQATIARAILSERQLFEVMADVWTNHFNVYLGKGQIRALYVDYLTNAIRANALGTFEELLLATARHPAMLVYLDNFRSVASTTPPPRGGQRPANAPTGLNENYARELLELHTLGVDGGYTQQDVVAVARILTGWGIQAADGAQVFRFRAAAHDRGAKTVMGKVFPAGGGEEEGVELLKWLAQHPATMRHVSAVLCARFVADTPPDGCIDAGVYAWKASRGDLKEVVGAILRSPEFWAPEYREVKIKSPFEFLASAARAVGAVPDTTLALPGILRRLEQPLFLYSPPTGYPERLESWVNGGALFDRFNVAVALASRRPPGLVVDVDRLLPERTAAQLPDLVIARILQGRASDATRQVLVTNATGPGAEDPRRLLLGLALGSPEFQRQ